ncbi:hypothetical protein Vadar_024801 [Vaccinium darrowii]|uniref:Uncharacterized protein n=1 Tax=Vaccinium darrowii TaxID=229202 RepID=A0ACB7XU56_9ERIC|nr:hypothetical protein Vadar_024801 [Vaccinium darrowii]
MMKSEDAQLSKEMFDIEAGNTVLIASHSSAQNKNNLIPGTQPVAYGSGNQGVSQPQYGSQQYFPTNTQQYGSNNSRNFSRGKGGRRFHCDICGRNNHSTDFCYYRHNGSGYQWRGVSNTPQVYSTMYGPQGMPGMPVVQNVLPQFATPQGQNTRFKPSGSTVPMCTMPYVPYSVPYYTPGSMAGGEMMPRQNANVPTDADFKPFIKTIILVATLIATVTFAAAFTMPGGFDTRPKKEGVATLVTKAALKVFILSDTFSMCCSITVVLLLSMAMLAERDVVSSIAQYSMTLLYLAFFATLVAFMSGIFAAIAPKALWVAILILSQYSDYHLEFVLNLFELLLSHHLEFDFNLIALYI